MEGFFDPNEMRCVLYSFCSPESLTKFSLQKKNGQCEIGN